jgi:hypothetical protein
MQFHRDDWRRVFRSEVLEQIVRRVAEFKALIDPTRPLTQIALRFCLSQPAVTAMIPGVRSAEQVRCHLGVLGQGALPEALLDQIERCWQEERHRQVRTSIGEEGEREQQGSRSLPSSSLALEKRDGLLLHDGRHAACRAHCELRSSLLSLPLAALAAAPAAASWSS